MGLGDLVLILDGKDEIVGKLTHIFKDYIVIDYSKRVVRNEMIRYISLK